MIEKTLKQIKIKGNQDGLLITADHRDWHTFQEELILQISERENFFHGAKIALDVEDLVVHAAEMGLLRDRLSDKGVTLRAVISSSSTTIKTAEMLGLDTALEKKRTLRKDSETDKAAIADEAIFIKRTLRSGVCLQSEKSIIVLGDVNPGAEILSGQNIIVWGRLRGTVHAGKRGNHESIVCALFMAPSLLRIGESILELPVKLKKTKPYMAKINQGIIQLVPWE